MSLHAQLSPEARDKLRKQQRNSTISSLVISLLSILLVGVILLYWFLPTIENITPDIVSYQSGAEEEDKLQKKKISRAVERTPSSPSSAMAKVIAANTVSDIAIPVPETNAEISMDLGNGDDFGDGWGDGDGWGSGGGTTFFGTKLAGERILYIIDYSGSMRGIKDKLMRKELADSVNKLPHDKKYQLIFFSGPAWVAGDTVKLQRGKKGAIIEAKGGRKYDWTCNGGAHNWATDGKTQQPKWIEADDRNIKASQKIIAKDKLVWGTDWRSPLDMAFTMDPLPNVIIFMTDGGTGNGANAIAAKYSSMARRKQVVINTISLMDAKTAEAMKALAEGTGGTFSLINENGQKQKVGKLEKKAPKKGKKK